MHTWVADSPVKIQKRTNYPSRKRGVREIHSVPPVPERNNNECHLLTALAVAAHRSLDERVGSAPRRDARDLRAPRGRRGDHQLRAIGVPSHARVVQSGPADRGGLASRHACWPALSLAPAECDAECVAEGTAECTVLGAGGSADDDAPDGDVTAEQPD